MSRVEGFPSSTEIKKVRIGGQNDEYLCVLNEDKTLLQLAYLCKGQAESDDFRNYIRALNIGRTEEISINGMVSFTSRTLTQAEVVSYDTLLARMNEARIYAGHYWENEVFTKILTGKYLFER